MSDKYCSVCGGFHGQTTAGCTAKSFKTFKTFNTDMERNWIYNAAIDDAVGAVENFMMGRITMTWQAEILSNTISALNALKK